MRNVFYFSKKVRLFSQNDVLFLFYFLINPAGTTVPYWFKACFAQNNRNFNPLEKIIECHTRCDSTHARLDSRATKVIVHSLIFTSVLMESSDWAEPGTNGLNDTVWKFSLHTWTWTGAGTSSPLICSWSPLSVKTPLLLSHFVSNKLSRFLKIWSCEIDPFR